MISSSIGKLHRRDEGVFNSIQITIINQYIIEWIMMNEAYGNQVPADKSVGGESSDYRRPSVYDMNFIN